MCIRFRLGELDVIGQGVEFNWGLERGYKSKRVGGTNCLRKNVHRAGFAAPGRSSCPRTRALRVVRIVCDAAAVRTLKSARKRAASARSASLPVERLICGAPQTNVPRSSIRGQQEPI